MKIIHFFLVIFTIFFSFQASAYLAPLLGSAGAIAAFVAFIFAIVASFAFLIWFHCRNFIKKVFCKSEVNEKPKKTKK
ncbi:MAG: hypothetical protein ISQ32_03170 [Rickettsiales bacterium]|nr:hypothetical protein [Rickettsiales bacterium]